MMNDIKSLLFKTEALRVSPEDKLFWYTSGTIGPYYINAHFLYGSESKANELLATIDDNKGNEYEMPGIVAEAVINNYKNDDFYKNAIDIIVSYIRDNISVREIDFISGGERRDWFFSFIVANLLDKPHITVYKDLRVVYGSEKPKGTADKVREVTENTLAGRRCLHISDLVTEASSFERAWRPAIEKAGGGISWSLTVVDRMQGGRRLIESLGSEHHALIEIDGGLFNTALERGYVNQRQHDMILAYIDDPKVSMKAFIDAHPEFLKSTLEGGGKDAERAKLCLERGVYDNFRTENANK